MLPFLMALSHNVRRVLNDPLRHGRKLVESLFGEEWIDHGTVDLVFVRIADTHNGVRDAQVFIKVRCFQVWRLRSVYP